VRFLKIKNTIFKFQKFSIRLDFARGARDNRKLAVWHLAIPTVAHSTAHFLVSKWAYDAIYAMAKRHVVRWRKIE
jgi:hypothetical protein